MRIPLVLLTAVAALAAAGVPRARSTQQSARGPRKRSGLPVSNVGRKLESLEPEYAADELFVQRDGTMLSAGTLTSAPVDEQTDRPQPSATELGGMIALFNDLDANDDQLFEKAELGGALTQLGLHSKKMRQPAELSWDHALQVMDLNDDEVISEREVVNHMVSDLVMSKREVANWLSFGVGLPQHADAFLAHSITGHDLPTLLEEADTVGADYSFAGGSGTETELRMSHQADYAGDGSGSSSRPGGAYSGYDGDDILRNDLNVTLSLHRRQIRRAIVALIFGDKPPRPRNVRCEDGPRPGTVLITWRHGELQPSETAEKSARTNENSPGLLRPPTRDSPSRHGYKISESGDTENRRPSPKSTDHKQDPRSRDGSFAGENDARDEDEGGWDDGEDYDEYTYRLRRHDLVRVVSDDSSHSKKKGKRSKPKTHKWQTVATLNGVLAFVDTDPMLTPGRSEITYKLDAWSVSGGSPEVRVSGCRARPSGPQWLVETAQRQGIAAIHHIATGWADSAELAEFRETHLLILMATVFVVYERRWRRHWREQQEREQEQQQQQQQQQLQTPTYVNLGASPNQDPSRESSQAVAEATETRWSASPLQLDAVNSDRVPGYANATVPLDYGHRYRMLNSASATDPGSRPSDNVSELQQLHQNHRRFSLNEPPSPRGSVYSVHPGSSTTNDATGRPQFSPDRRALQLRSAGYPAGQASVSTAAQQRHREEEEIRQLQQLHGYNDTGPTSPRSLVGSAHPSFGDPAYGSPYELPRGISSPSPSLSRRSQDSSARGVRFPADRVPHRSTAGTGAARRHKGLSFSCARRVE